MIKLPDLAAVLIILACLSVNTNSQERIKFPKGESSATVEGGVERGGSHYYLIKASRNQWAAVTIMSVEDNAVFLSII